MSELHVLKSVENYEHLNEILERVSIALQDFLELEYVYIGRGEGCDPKNNIIKFMDSFEDITYFRIYCKLSDLIEKTLPDTPVSPFSPYYEIKALSRMKSVTLDVDKLPYTRKLIEAPIHDKIPELARKSLVIQKRGGFYRAELWRMIGEEECKYLEQHYFIKRENKTTSDKAICRRCGEKKEWREMTDQELSQYMVQEIKK